MAGLIYDSTGKYNLMFWITIFLLVAAIVLFTMARVPVRPAPPTTDPH
ncbi:MAG: hypothetical protein O3B95_11135 [Chloroflexi bacterium]|nr:hypothetical protein [Chloroflexota bacterium]